MTTTVEVIGGHRYRITRDGAGVIMEQVCIDAVPHVPAPVIPALQAFLALDSNKITLPQVIQVVRAMAQKLVNQ